MKPENKKSSGHRKSRQSVSNSHSYESLERRRMLATFTVTDASVSNSSSLHQPIVDANGDLGALKLKSKFLLGDADQNGTVDFSDIPSFASVLQSGAFLEEADIDRNGVVDFSDIDPFVILLASLPSDDHGNDAGSATTINTPANIAGTFESSGDQDWFSFNAVAGQEYVFETPIDSYTRLSLYATDGVTILKSSGFLSKVSWFAPASGTYFLSVNQLNGSASSDYHLLSHAWITDSKVRLDANSYYASGAVNFDIADSTGFSPGATVLLESTSGDMETLPILSNGVVFSSSISTTEDAASLNDGVLQVATGDTVTATYFDSDDGFGSTFTADDSAAIVADDHGDDAATATLLYLSSNALGSIEVTGDSDWFSFNAVAGMTHRFELPSGRNRGLMLYDSDGTTQLEQSLPGSSLITWDAPSNGTYYVSVGGFDSSGIGSYQLSCQIYVDNHGDDAATGTLLSLPANVTGSIDFVGDQDWFSFDASAGTLLHLEVPFHDSRPEIILYDTDGTTQLVRDTSNSPSLFASLTNDGTYYISIENFSSSNISNYTLSVSEIEDGHGDNAASATELEFPVSVSSSIEFTGDADWFSFNAIAGATYVFEIPVNDQHELTLYDTDGITQLEQDDSSSPYLVWDAPADGTHFLSVANLSTDTDDLEVKDYELSASMFFDDHGDDTATATTLDLPESVSGSIEIEGDLDWFSFSASAGQKFEFQVAVYDEVPELSLYDTDGVTQLDVENFSTSILWSAPSDGIYYLSVGHDFSSNPGTYELSATVLADEDGDSAAAATAIDLPANVLSSIAVPGDQDWFSFNASAGETYRFEVPDDEFDTVLTMYDTDGTTQLDQDSFFDPSIIWDAPTDGIFYLSVENFVNNEFGDYELTAELIFDDHGEGIARATALNFPANVSGAIEQSGDTDWFSFSAVAGETYSFETPVFELLLTRILYDTDGTTQLLQRRNNQSMFWVAPVDGTYYLSLDQNFTGDIGNYELTADVISDDHGDDAETATNFDFLGNLSGAIDIQGDQDWLSFEVAEGETYQFEILASDEFTTLTLYDNNGTSQLGRDFGSSPSIFWNVPRDGTYYLAVNFSQDETGDYDLSTTSFIDNEGDSLATAAQIELPAFVSSAVEAESDQDWFRFNTIAGENYRIDLSTRDLNTELKLYDTDGISELVQDSVSISSSSGISRTTFWVAPSNGPYYLSAEGLGAYDLSVALVTDDHGGDAATATALALPATIPGSFDTLDDQDWFSFTAVAGEKYLLEASDRPSGRSTRLEIFDLDGTTLLGEYESFWIAPSSGTYFLSLENFSGTGASGLENYELSVNLSPDDYGDSATRANPLSFPPVLPGVIELELDQDWFRFDAVTSNNYVFDATNTSHTLELRILASDGTTELANQTSGGPLTWAPASDGTYYFSIQARPGFDLPEYELSAEIIVDDFGDDAASSTLIDLGTSVNGSLETRGDEDWFSFNAVAGTNYEISLSNISLSDPSLPSTLANGRLRLFGTNGTTTIISRAVDNLSFTWIAPSDGTRFISASGWQFSEIFTYTLSFSVAIDDHRNEPGAATLLDLPANISGTNERSDDEDWFRFNAIAGEEFHFEIPQHDQSIILSVYDTNGVTILDRDLYDSPSIFWTAPQNGSFFLSVEPRLNFGTGAYNLLARAVAPDDFGDDAATATPLNLPANISGAIEFGGDPDWFSFNAVAGEQYHISVPDHDGDIRLRLYDSDGSSSLEFDNSYTPNIFWTAPSDGTYYLSLDYFFTFFLGDYELSVSAVVDDHGDDSSTSTLFQVPTNISGAIGFRGDRDWFRFDAVADLVYDYQLEWDGVGDGELSVLDTDGTTVLVNDIYNPDISWIAPSNGTFYLVAEGVDEDDFGDYQLIASSRLQETSISFNQVSYLTPNEVTIDLVDATGFAQGSKLTIESSSGDSEIIEITSSGIYFSTTLSSADGAATPNDGTLQIADGDRLVATFLDEDQAIGGRYFIDSASIFVDDHGDDANSATLADSSGTTSGSIVVDDDQDWFSFSAIAGLDYVFEISLTEHGNFFDSRLTLYDTDGVTPLASDQKSGSVFFQPVEGALISWQAPKTGVYFIAVESDDHLIYQLGVSSSGSPAFVVGDVNQDGVIDFSDIPSFITGLQGGVYLEEADINVDGVFDFADIPFFIDLLIAQ